MNIIGQIEKFVIQLLDNIGLKQQPSRIRKKNIVPRWDVLHRQNYTEYSGEFILFGKKGNILYRIPGKIVIWPGLPTDVFIFNPPRYN